MRIQKRAPGDTSRRSADTAIVVRLSVAREFRLAPPSTEIRSGLHPMATDRRPEFFKGTQLKVGIIGCGYVGLPLALRFAEAGHKVTGFDTDPHKVRLLNSGKSYIEHIQQTKIQQYVNSRHFSATTEFERLKEVDAILICVPTPLDEYREPDLSYLEETATSILPNLQKGHLGGAQTAHLPRHTGGAGPADPREEWPALPHRRRARK